MTLPEHLVNAPVRAALVTGAAGFIGKGLAGCLAARGARVVSLDLPGRDAGGDTRPVDLADLAAARTAVAAAVADLGPETVVFHLAGFANASICRTDPPGAFAANVTATVNVLEACRAAGLSRVVFPSTALVYGLSVLLPMHEDAALAPRSIYAASKAAAEALLAGYAADCGFSVDVARLGNVYGPGGPAEAVVPTLLQQILGEGRVHLRTLAPVRDFVHRDDVADGLIRLAEAGREPGLRVYNLSSGVATSIARLAEMARDAVGHALPPVETEPGTRHDDRIVLDIERLRARTGWVPSIPLADGLQQILRVLGDERA